MNGSNVCFWCLNVRGQWNLHSVKSFGITEAERAEEQCLVDLAHTFRFLWLNGCGTSDAIAYLRSCTR